MPVVCWRVPMTTSHEHVGAYNHGVQLPQESHELVVDRLVLAQEGRRCSLGFRCEGD
jgi:hypothetical protein